MCTRSTVQHFHAEGRIEVPNGEQDTKLPARILPKHLTANAHEKVVSARHARNNRLTDALFQQAFDSLQVRDIGHNDTLRRLSNRLVGTLHGCLRHGTSCDEVTA